MFQNIEIETYYRLLKLMVLEKQRFDSSNQHLHNEHQSGWQLAQSISSRLTGAFILIAP
jgi:hypothetical protein